MLENNAYVPAHIAVTTYVPVHFAQATPAGFRRAVCRAGLAALIAASVVPCAYAADMEVPDAGWAPDAPTIDGSETPTPDPVPEPDPTPTPDPVPDEGDGGSADVPDSGTDVPSYSETYPSGDTSSYAANEAAFTDAGAAATVEETSVPASLAVAPTFTNYEAATNTVAGVATAGATLRFLDAAGNVVGETIATEDGSFWYTLPAGVDLSGISIFTVDANGVQTSEVLLGASIAQELAAREAADVRATVGDSASSLASDLRIAVADLGVATSLETGEEEGMPVVPYALGALSALAAAGAVGAGVFAVSRIVRRRDEVQDEQVPMGQVAIPFLPDDDVDVQAATSPAASSGARAVDEDLDELERLAFGSHGAPASVGHGTSKDSHFSFDNDTLSSMTAVAADTWGVPGDGDDDPEPPDGPSGGPAPRADSTAAFLAVAASLDAPPAPAPSESEPVSSVPKPVEHDLARTGAPSSGVLFQAGDDPDATIPGPAVQPPVDPETFAVTAHILATGSGAVHRVVASKRDVDFAGLDYFDEGRTPVASELAADPMVENGDWRSVALAELALSDAGSDQGTGGRVSTEDYVALLQTRRQRCVRPDVGDDTRYVAPVVGPSFLSQEEALRRRMMVEQAATPEASALRSRDEAFKRRRSTGAAADSTQDGVPQIARGPVTGDVAGEPDFFSAPEPTPARLPSPQLRTSPTQRVEGHEGVPVIVRGSTSAIPGPAPRPRSVSDLVPSVERSISIPTLDPVLQPSDPAPSVARAVSAALAAYANYAPVKSGPMAEMSAPRPADTSPDVTAARLVAAAPDASQAYASAAQVFGAPLASDPSHSVAAAYAAAVYANVALPCPMPVAESVDRSFLPSSVPAVAPADGFAGPSEELYATTPLSPAYINYLVQEEFEHRHDTPAQRNAALGRMRIVNGAATAPVSVRDGVAMRRHMA